MSSIATADPTQARTIPLEACRFIWDDAVQFAQGDKSENRFEILAYDGSIIAKHWYWGNLGIDLDGLSFEQDRTPVFDSHNYDRRIGFATAQEIRPKVRFTGQFLENGEAQKLRTDMKAGFPMQASLGLVPLDVEQVKEGASMVVNGRRLEGPGAVFRKAQIREVSMAAFGAAPGTSATAFAAGGPMIVQTAFDEATATEAQLRTHFATTLALRESFSGPDAYLAFVRHGGHDVDVLREHNRFLTRELEDAEAQLAGLR